MQSIESAQELVRSLARKLDFARRYYALVASTRDGEPCFDLPPSAINDALKSTGRSFRFNRKERFFKTREADAPAELGLNLTINGSVEFILVVKAHVGHVGRTFHGLALELVEQDAPELMPTPRYPRPSYRDADELRVVLAQGIQLYTELAVSILSSGLLGKA